MALHSCREVEAPASIGLEYYPLSEGQTWIYQVDSTSYLPFSADSVHYTFQRKNTVLKTIVDPAARLIYEIEQMQRRDSNFEWIYQKTFFVFKDRVMVEQNEDNIKIVPLVFPVKQNKSWDGNQLNNKGAQAFVYKEVGKARWVNGNFYPESFKVRQMDDSTFFDQFRDIEYYAKDVGLIYREHIDITTKNQEKSGDKVVWTLLEYRN